MQAEARNSRWLWVILFVGLLLRLAYAAGQPIVANFVGTGGDSGWYLAVGWGFFSGQEHGWIRNIPFINNSIPTPPAYILYAGLFQQFLAEQETVVAMRLLQCLASIATVYLVFRITRTLHCQRAGLVAAALAAFHPALVFEPSNIATETLFIFFLSCGLWLFVEHYVNGVGDGRASWLSPSAAIVLTAMAFSLATLTRAVSILFPLGLALHIALLRRRPCLRHWRRHIALLLAVYLAILLTWTVYNLALWDRFVFVSDRLLPTVWRGAESEDGSPQQNDALLLAGAEAEVPEGCEVDCRYHHPAALYLERIGEIIGADPAGLLALRANELAYSLLQPHGTTHLGNVSIREAALNWLNSGRSLAELSEITQIEGFWAKLLTWLFHLLGIVFGLPGMIMLRRRWPLSLPVMGYALYTVLAHSVLLALPRYLFTIEVIWLIFAGCALVIIQARWRRSGAKEIPDALTASAR